MLSPSKFLEFEAHWSSILTPAYSPSGDGLDLSVYEFKVEIDAPSAWAESE